MQDRVGAAPEAGVEGEGVADRRVADDLARSQVLLERTHDRHTALLGEAQALRIHRRHRAVAWQRQAEHLGEAVHRVGGEHARARAAGRTSRTLEGFEALVVEIAGHVAADRLERRVEVDGATTLPASEHRPAADHDGRDVEAHRRHEHARDDLVATRHEDEGVEGMAFGHGFDAVRHQLPTRQRVEHALVVHRDPVADARHAELERGAAGHAHAGLHRLGDLTQMHVTRDRFAERVGDADERTFHLGVTHAEGAQQRAVRGALWPMLDLVASHVCAFLRTRRASCQSTPP